LKDEIRDQLIGDGQHPITNKHMQALILEAFRLRRETKETGKTAADDSEYLSVGLRPWFQSLPHWRNLQTPGGR
jgi:hypothetical protein